MLMPKKVKYRKTHLRKPLLKATKANQLHFGEYGLQALQSGYITARQIEAVRVTLVRSFKKSGKVWIRVFPDVAVTSKPAETRMGGGKGTPEYWVVPVGKGRILFELAGMKEEQAQEAVRLASHKLPIRTRLVKRII